MNKTLILSIIVSCYNSSPYIERLLNSIVENHISKERYEVLIVDDNSTDNFIELVKPFGSILPIKYLNTKSDIHCPGNTRNIGIENAKGQWITFIDHDDTFEPTGLQDALSILLENQNIQTILTTDFREYSEDCSEILKDVVSVDANGWVHGKFFNRLNLIEKYNLRFRPDMETHEDIHFINNVHTIMYLNNLIPYHANIFTYRWIYHENSLSRRTLKDKHTYLDVHMDTYLDSASYIFVEHYRKSAKSLSGEQKLYLKSNMIYGLLYCYFYIQADKFRNNGEFIEKNLDCFKKCRDTICETLDITIDDILNFVVSDAVTYNQVRNSSFIGGGVFIESQTFKEFLDM